VRSRYSPSKGWEKSQKTWAPLAVRGSYGRGARGSSGSCTREWCCSTVTNRPSGAIWPTPEAGLLATKERRTDTSVFRG
jgi:hypothetical protein